MSSGDRRPPKHPPTEHRLGSVCVYCGSSAGGRPAYARAAEEMGRALGQKGITLVYGGGKVGLMGALANAALEAGGEVVGVIPQGLVDREVAHEALSRLLITASMHERKARMAELSDAFVALPGGLGTLEELFESWTWGQLGIHKKPLGLLDVEGYFDPLITFLNHAVGEGFVRKPHRGMLVRAAKPDALLDRLAAWEPPRVEKWLSPKES